MEPDHRGDSSAIYGDHGDVKLLVSREPGSRAWAAVRITGPNTEANIVLGTGEAECEEEAKARAEHHAEE